MSDQRIRIIDRRIVADGWARLEAVRFDYRRASGEWQEQEREIYHRGHGAAILLYAEARASVVLVRQFRLPAYEVDGCGFLLEAPAGIIDAGDPTQTVRKEVAEETGYEIGEPRFLFKAYVSPGSVTEQIHYFAAPYSDSQRVHAGGGESEEGEDIEVVEMPFEEACRAIDNGGIVDAKTIILLQHARIHLFPGA
ncbi:MAG: GDP-mannose pyrophosphatase [Gammaproteobacteria bacterium]|nr:MAG: GDP-mannose pyrophosphatase [Gammaproteobacteria bacterium]